MNHLKQTLTILAMLGAAGGIAAETDIMRNGGFESVRGGQFDHWGYNRKDAVKHSPDTQEKHSGKYSLRIGNIDTYDAFVNAGGKISDFQDDLLLRGWIKYENLSNATIDGKTHILPFIGLWTNNANGSNNISFPALKLAPGSRDWFHFEKVFSAADLQKSIAAMQHDRRPATWSFRINVANQPGTIWIDDLELIKLPKTALSAGLNSKEYTSSAQAELSLQLDPSKSIDGKGTLQLAILDAAGKTVWSKTVPADKVTLKESIDISKLAAGRYKLTVTPDNAFQAKPVELEFGKVADAFAE